MLLKDIKQYEKEWFFVIFLLSFFTGTTNKSCNKLCFTYIHGFNGLLSIGNMGVDTNITLLLAIKAKILQNTEILAKSPTAILNHDVYRLLNAKIF